MVTGISVLAGEIGAFTVSSTKPLLAPFRAGFNSTTSAETGPAPTRYILSRSLIERTSSAVPA